MPKASEEAWESSNSEDENVIYADVGKDEFNLQYYQSSICATILEDTITELRILEECNSSLGIIKTLSDMGVLLARKYGVHQPVVTEELVGTDARNLGCDENKLNKLEADRRLVSGVIQGTYSELALKGSFKPLVDFNNRIIDSDIYRMVLQDEEAKNRIQLKELKKQLRQQSNHNKMAIYDTDVIIDNLRAEYEDASLNAEIQSRYAMNWEKARTEQHLKLIKDKEEVPTESIEIYKARTDYEQRVHTDIELITNIAINETLAKVENWMTKYDIDMEAIDLKIQIQKNDYQNMLTKRVGLEDTIEKHDTLIKQWLKFKKDREERLAYIEKMTTSAIIVQAWWRGLLVRRQLGPFKVAKKKKEKKK